MKVCALQSFFLSSFHHSELITHAIISYRMEIVKEKEAETTEECELARKKAREARQIFEKVKTERYRRFHEFFDPVSQKIDEIYKVCCSS